MPHAAPDCGASAFGSSFVTTFVLARADEVQKETKDQEDDKVYRGMNNYAQYIEKREALQGKRITTKGPIR